MDSSMLTFLNQSCGEQLWTAGILFCVTDSGDSLFCHKSPVLYGPSSPMQIRFPAVQPHW